MKIKYISSPIMVNTRNAFEFRAIVQQLTGKNSTTTGVDGTYTMLKRVPSLPVPNYRSVDIPYSMVATDQERNSGRLPTTPFDDIGVFGQDFTDSLSGF